MKMSPEEQDWALKHADKIRRLAVIICEVNDTHKRGDRSACQKCSKAAREFFNEMTFGHEVVSN